MQTQLTPVQIAYIAWIKALAARAIKQAAVAPK